MDDEAWWRADKPQRAKILADDILALAARARGARFEIVAYMLELAAKEASKEGGVGGSA